MVASFITEECYTLAHELAWRLCVAYCLSFRLICYYVNYDFTLPLVSTDGIAPIPH